MKFLFEFFGYQILFCLFNFIILSFIYFIFSDTGGLSSLRIDRQGKTYAQVMLTLPFPTPEGGLPESGKRACRL